MNGPSIPVHGDAILLGPYGAVYIEVPKVACSSIKVALAGILQIDLEEVDGDPHEADFPLPPPSEDPAALYPGLFSFAFVRNPWDRLVSCYRDKILGEVADFTSFHPTRGVAYCLARFGVFHAGMPFADFVRAVADISDDEADDHFRSQHVFLTNADGDVAADFVGRFETLVHDFERVGSELGLPTVTLPHVQAASPRKRYADFYTPETRSMVSDRFQDDISHFGYDFDVNASPR